MNKHVTDMQRSEYESRPDVLVSTVIPAYNARKFICRALDSVLAQDIPNGEIIVVDDGSTDGTRELVASYQSRGVRLICHGQTGGAGAARNTGINAARGEYIAFLDADDEWLPGKLRKQIELLARNPQMSFASCRASLIDETGYDRGDIYRGAAPAVGPRAWRSLLAYPCVATPSVVARRAAINAVGPFNRWMPVAEDQDLWIRLSLRGEVGYVPETLVKVYSTPNSLSKAQIRNQAGYVLPMIVGYVSRNDHQLTRTEIRAILCERYNKTAQWAYANNELAFSLKAFWRAMLYGQSPLKVMIYMARASFVARWCKSLIKAFRR